ncbi:Fur family transcriptional regulator [Desulfobacca acetoxidans]|uniref:Ferric uptake regulation protein n=1 Tax=Desulfobacca acetoxidans (strain ATCC 700848 / DSM 11109 / ASRB2) TaxID=880072 RepID=F2NJS9_DESAR|nr:transcriptional repressor [Desulfobacca acetoxidans]AEB09734.1 ferric uptake regulator, Fur family [Desulfobacca acetoxidans DSM 11109]
MKPELKIFQEFIRSRGLRQTPERQCIVAEIFRKKEHFNVDELFMRLRTQGKKISKASIYRTLPLLKDCGLIREVNFSDGHWHYEQTYGQPHHCHLRCLCCGAIVEFEEPLMNVVERKLSYTYGYKISKHVLEVQGLCPRCQEAAANRGLEAKHA